MTNDESHQMILRTDPRQETCRLKKALTEAGIEARIHHDRYGCDIVVAVQEKDVMQARRIARQVTGRRDWIDGLKVLARLMPK